MKIISIVIKIFIIISIVIEENKFTTNIVLVVVNNSDNLIFIRFTNFPLL